MNKKEKEAQRHQEDVALNKGLCWVGGAVVLELLLILVKRYYLNFRTDGFEIKLAGVISTVLNVLRVAGPVVFVLCLVWLIFSLKKNRGALLPTVLGVAAAALSICAHVAVFFQANGVQMLFLLVPVMAGLALAYYIYQKEFFLSALAGSLSVLGLWFVRYRGGFNKESLLALIAIVLVLLFSMYLKKHEGMLMSIRFLPARDAAYGPVTVGCVVAIAALLIGLIFGDAAAYYLIFMMIAWVFALLVYFTVKLM